MGGSTPRNGRPEWASVSTLLRPVRAAAFWTAVVLPFCSLALFGTGAVEPAARTLGSLFGLYLAALVVGHGYRR